MLKDASAEIKRAVKVMKINVSGDEQDKLSGDLQDFMAWIEVLSNVDAADVEPMLVAHSAAGVYRADRPRAGDKEALQKAGPAVEEGFYPVPPIIE